ncbi:mediator of RNA polymerase II transcription subunit 13-like [Bidens hawaiensis]|uniref:mediator of RNA polymerase II transcription subunit 13-like n=1 Tax=Bidens hawaiensis TaxID=980011 RepID=UPI004049B396
MWTNVFKIGGLHQVSWFQFLPNESDANLSDRSLNSNQKDAAAQLVISSHLQLQKDGFLSMWGNSFVGPWDPSQGLHNPDEKIKLWLFIPGRHSSVVDKAKAAVSKLRGFASGVWLAPGDSEEVAAALSQALKNCIERALMGLSYMRFGDVFSRYHPSSQGEELFRRGQPVLEFTFTATEEGIFVHVIISAKHVRALSSGDMETILKRTSSNSSVRLPVIVSPHGMRGRITRICPGDLVKQLYLSSGKFKAINGIVGLPNQFSQSSGCQLRGQNCYLEVTLGCETAESEKSLPPNSNTSSKNHISESLGVTKEYEKTFIYPAEAVLVPLVQTSSARSSLKRFWLQNWMGPSLSSSSFSMQCDAFGTMDGSWHDNDMRAQNGYNSSGNSNSSSISTSSSSDSDYRMTCETGDLEADADSLSCMKSGLPTADQMHIDGSKLGSKRSRAGMGESYGPAGAIINAQQDGYNSINNDQGGSGWDWDDDDKGVVMDIQALLSEFGDFGDFFENDVLPFGEPPGTEESQTPMFSATDGGDASSSPFTGMIDTSDPMILPVGFSSFESFNPPSTVIEESISKNQEFTKDALSSGSMNYNPPAPTSSEFDYLIKAEALMTFAPEYGAVETPTTDALSSLIKSPYIPKSRTAESANSSTNNYIYSATPPQHDISDDKTIVGANSKDKYLLQSKKFYTHVESGKNDKKDEKLSSCDNIVEDVAPSAFSGFNSSNTGFRASTRNKITESFLISSKTSIANELECIMFQAFMCKIRHTLLTPTSSLQMSRLSGGNALYQMHGESSGLPDNISNKYDIKKKETIPVRIAGDLDGGLLDGPLNPPVGVWRTVGVTKGSKPMTSSMEPFGSLPHNSFNEEGMLSYGQRQPLLELLDGMPLLVQQATSFVDVTLDADCGDGPYGWLAMQEQLRRGFSCGPALVHAGCGGVLSSCHSLDIAGVELADPLSADVHASYAITLLQTDIKSALKSAFGTFDGPLTVTDWCKGRNGQTDVFSAESSASINDSLVEPISPSQSADGTRVDDISESEQQLGLRPALLVIPIPAILVGYQDDWLKTSATALQHWEKAPFEPYALKKHMNYCVVCPDIDPLTTAAADFFQQLETVYETCKLGTHSPQNFGNQTAKDLGKCSSSGFVLLDCPQSMKIESDSASLVGSISDYFLSLSNGWDLTSFLKSLSKVLKALKLNSCFAPTSKEGNSTPCTVIYVVCPFPEPVAVLKTVVESCVAIGSVVFPSSDKERRTAMQNQVGKALSCSTAVDDASISNVVTISGFSIPKLVLQVVTVDAIFRVTSPSLNEPIILKEIAFTVYNKARKISRGSSADVMPSVSVSGRPQSHSSMMQMSSSMQGMWKDSLGPRMGPREGELDAGLRAGVWDNSWQMTRSDRPGEYYIQDELKYMFEPLFILAEPGSSERGLSPDSLKLLSDDGTSSDTGMGSQMDGSDDGFGSGHKQPLGLHCCYGWTEDWRWLVCIWTDSRGELLDSCTFPFGGISSRQDTKGLQFLFVQILQQGCQILQACSSDSTPARPHDFVITRIGCFFELECQEWQKALYSIGGSEVKKWSLQLRRSVPDGMTASSNGGPQDMSIIQDRNLQSHTKGSNYLKGGLGQPLGRKQLGGSHIAMDNSKGLLQWVQSITFVSVSVDHSLQLVYQADSSPGTTQGSGVMGQSCYVEGFTPVKSLGSASTSYIFVPSPSMRFLPPNPLQLPTCLTSESQPLAHLLHSKGSAIPISTGFVVSKAVPSMRKDSRTNCKEEWPSVLSVGLFDYYGSNNNNSNTNNNSNHNNEKGKSIGKSGMENHLILERVAAELHALSWMTVSPGYLERRTALPFHCDMVLRLRRLLHFADKELSQPSVKSEV